MVIINTLRRQLLRQPNWQDIGKLIQCCHTAIWQLLEHVGFDFRQAIFQLYSRDLATPFGPVTTRRRTNISTNKNRRGERWAPFIDNYHTIQMRDLEDFVRSYELLPQYQVEVILRNCHQVILAAPRAKC
ncbi:hypothetical protein ACH5RR_022895 [Cinchona calisaya]|uniref:Uncharacterized protein n=1 Tax=Cinchona calisaya TaxID=153742 RepID=A0ABD2ZA57_9GENT